MRQFCSRKMRVLKNPRPVAKSTPQACAMHNNNFSKIICYCLCFYIVFYLRSIRKRFCHFASDEEERKAAKAFMQRRLKSLEGRGTQSRSVGAPEPSMCSASASAQLRGVTSERDSDRVAVDVLIGKIKANNTISSLKAASAAKIHSPSKCKPCRFSLQIQHFRIIPKFMQGCSSYFSDAILNDLHVTGFFGIRRLWSLKNSCAKRWKCKCFSFR